MNPLLQRALILVEQSRYDLAEKELHLALAQTPDDPTAHAILAICFSENNKFAEATQEANLAIQLAPEDSFVFYAQSLVLRARNHFPEAQNAIEEAISIDPYRPEYFAQLSLLHFDQRRWRDTLNAAEKGLELDPEDVECTNTRSMALVKLGRPIEAGATLETALKRDPEDAVSHANMGYSLIERGKNQEAMLHFREALRLEPGFEWARAGIIEAMKGRFFIYRIMLGWFLWMMKLSGRAQWGVIVGAYIGYQILRRVAAANPAMAVWITPVLVAYVGFVIMTWIASPLFNLILRLDRMGRLTLSREQIRTSNWIGLTLVTALSFVVIWFATSGTHFLVCAVAVGLLTPALSSFYSCSPGWPRASITLLTLALLGMVCSIVAGFVAGHFLTGRPADLLMGIANLTFLAHLVAAIASQFGVNFLISATPRQETARGVWLVGGSMLAAAALLYMVISALLILASFQDLVDGEVTTQFSKRSKAASARVASGVLTTDERDRGALLRSDTSGYAIVYLDLSTHPYLGRDDGS